jgi:uncharacterized protein (TIGR03086 family)
MVGLSSKRTTPRTIESMDQLVAHQRAQDLFAAVFARVTVDQMSAPTPCTEWDVSALVDHVIGGNGWVQQLAGREIASVPEEKSEALAASAAGAQSVFAADDGMSRMFELPFGTMPGVAFVGLRASDVFMHAWDLAKATGQSTDLDPELAAEALAAAKMRIQPAMRGAGRPFQAEQACPEGRPVADQFAAFLGRVVD